MTQSAHAARWIALALLVTTYIFAYLDRQLLGILAQPIKDELHLSDTLLGFLGGGTFAIFYATLGIPVSRLIDRYSRRGIMVVSLASWSLFTALTSTVGSFWQLLLFRIGVAAGEAGCNPSAHSLIADYFPRHLRATAMALYGAAIPVGAGLAMLLGGTIGHAFGWRTAFLAVGIGGVCFAAVLLMFLREPPRGLSEPDRQQREKEDHPSFREVVKQLLARRSYVHKTLGVALLGTSSISGIMWHPALLTRSYGMDLSSVGFSLALILCLGGGGGAIIGGLLADRVHHLGARRQLMLPAWACALCVPLALLAYLGGAIGVVLACIAAITFLHNIQYGPVTSMSTRLAPLRGRGMASGLSMFVTNFIAAGLGAQLVGIFSDLLRPAFAEESLRMALLLTNAAFMAWAGLHYWLAARCVEADLAPLEGSGPDPVAAV